MSLGELQKDIERFRMGSRIFLMRIGAPLIIGAVSIEPEDYVDDRRFIEKWHEMMVDEEAKEWAEVFLRASAEVKAKRRVEQEQQREQELAAKRSVFNLFGWLR